MENLTLFPLYQPTCFFIPLVAPCKPLLPYIDYNSLEEFHTLKSVCSLFKIDKDKLREKCGQYGISPQKNEVGDWGLTRFDVRKLHNFLYYEDKKNVGNRKGDDPWA